MSSFSSTWTKWTNSALDKNRALKRVFPKRLKPPEQLIGRKNHKGTRELTYVQYGTSYVEESGSAG